MLDLFSGLKGASQAFEAAGWEVVTVDNNPDLNPTICCNVEDLYLHPDFQKYMVKNYFDLIWASPPCVEFYKVSAPWFDEFGQLPSLELVEDSLALIQILKPKYWILENTKMGKRFISKVLGNPKLIIEPFFFWGRFPLFDAAIDKNHKALNDPGPSNKLRSNIRAKIPLEISRSLLDVVENQTDLSRWI
tara:strand:- start:862 stop:1431 length:570 start_codon:yes stop_codon:yes gene_type:complete